MEAVLILLSHISHSFTKNIEFFFSTPTASASPTAYGIILSREIFQFAVFSDAENASTEVLNDVGVLIGIKGDSKRVFEAVRSLRDDFRFWLSQRKGGACQKSEKNTDSGVAEVHD